MTMCGIKMGRVLAALVACVAGAGLVSAEVVRHRDAHEGPEVMLLGATADGGGALVAEYDFTKPVVVTFDVAVGGLARYSGIDPFFQILEEDEPEEGHFRLDDGTPVTFELVAIDAAVGVRLNGVNLLEAGDAVLIGTMPNLHADPEWQLTLPEGEVDCRQVSFRLTTTAAGYATSETYTATLSNDPAGLCPGVPTPTPTVTPAPGAVCGDADGNGSVTVTDGVNVLRGAVGLPGCTNLAVCDVDGSGAMTVTDGVNVLRAAASLPATMTCPAL